MRRRVVSVAYETVGARGVVVVPPASATDLRVGGSVVSTYARRRACWQPSVYVQRCGN